MIYPFLRRSGLALSAAIAFSSITISVTAQPANVFTPHLDQIQQSLPPNLVMRLPNRVLLSGPADADFIDALIVKVLSSQSPPTMTVSLFTCDSGPQPCLVGSFSVDNKFSTNAQQELKKHQAAAAPIRLREGVRGYFLPGPSQKPPSRFSSVIWEQGNEIYTVSFFSGERQNILNMAYSMANSAPITRSGAPRNPSSRLF